MITKVFKSGNSMAVRIPKQIHIEGESVEISQKGKVITLRPVEKSLAAAYELFEQFPEDFFSEKRKDTPPQKRDFF